jgi:hypothetical protein
MCDLHSRVAGMPLFDVFFVIDQFDTCVFSPMGFNKTGNLLAVIGCLKYN